MNIKAILIGALVVFIAAHWMLVIMAGMYIGMSHGPTGQAEGQGMLVLLSFPLNFIFGKEDLFIPAFLNAPLWAILIFLLFHFLRKRIGQISNPS